MHTHCNKAQEKGFDRDPSSLPPKHKSNVPVSPLTTQSSKPLDLPQQFSSVPH